jgi:putative salt-induced outer membrane protein YdiY
MDPVTLNSWLLYFVLSQFPAATISYRQPPAPAPAPAAAKAERPSIVDGRAELSFVNTSGNAATQTIGTAAELNVRPGRWMMSSEARYVRTNADDSLQAETIESDLRVARTIFDQVSAYGETRYLRNTFAGIRRQTTFEFGMSKQFVRSEQRHLRGELAIGYVSEDRLIGDYRRLASGTAGFRYGLPISKQGRWSQQAYITTDLGDSSDWRLRHEASVAANLNTVLSLKFSHTLTYLHDPVPGFEHADTVGAAALVAKF